jgi:hypothetical protein
MAFSHPRSGSFPIRPSTNRLDQVQKPRDRTHLLASTGPDNRAIKPNKRTPTAVP